MTSDQVRDQDAPETLKQYLQRQLASASLERLPKEDFVYRIVLYKMRAMVSQLPDDFAPKDDLPAVDYPNDSDRIAYYHLRQMILHWRERLKEVEP